MSLTTPPPPAASASPPASAGRPGLLPLWRRLLLGAAAVISCVVVGVWIWRSVIVVISLLSRGPQPPAVRSVTTPLIIDQAVVLLAALLALVCVIAADGPRAVGVHHQPWPVHARAFGHSVMGPQLASYLGALALTVALALISPLQKITGTVPQDFEALPGWYLLYSSTVTSVAEEILVVAVLYRLLEYLPGTRNRPLAATAAGTAILVAVRLSYHSYYGLALLTLILWAWLTIRLYRTTRTLWPLILSHLAYNIAVQSTYGFTILTAIALFLLIVLTTGPRIEANLGFRPITTPAEPLVRFSLHRTRIPRNRTPDTTTPTQE